MIGLFSADATCARFFACPLSSQRCYLQDVNHAMSLSYPTKFKFKPGAHKKTCLKTVPNVFCHLLWASSAQDSMVAQATVSNPTASAAAIVDAKLSKPRGQRKERNIYAKARGFVSAANVSEV